MCVDAVEVKKTARVGSHLALCGFWGTTRGFLQTTLITWSLWSQLLNWNKKIAIFSICKWYLTVCTHTCLQVEGIKRTSLNILIRYYVTVRLGIDGHLTSPGPCCLALGWPSESLPYRISSARIRRRSAQLIIYCCSWLEVKLCFLFKCFL